MRKAFNFFKSYYEIAKELNDKDRLAFFDALLLKQFENKETELKGMAKFAYVSQKHSIDTQIKGYFDKTKDPMFDPCQGSTEPPSVQGEEEEEEQVQVKGQGQDIVSRKLKFADTLKPFLSIYSKDLLNEFYSYWTEPNKSNTKFRQELQNTWDLERRLKTWAKNDTTFNQSKTEPIQVRPKFNFGTDDE